MTSASSSTAPTEPSPSTRLLTGADVADLLGVTPRTVRRYAAEGRLPRIALGRRSTRYRLQDVLALIEACSQVRP